MVDRAGIEKERARARACWKPCMHSGWMELSSGVAGALGGTLTGAGSATLTLNNELASNRKWEDPSEELFEERQKRVAVLALKFAQGRVSSCRMETFKNN